MCTRQNRLRLCTCDADCDEPDWIPERHDASLPERIAVGMSFFPRYSEYGQRRLDIILQELRTGNPFDFPYRRGLSRRAPMVSAEGPPNNG